jgi:hypothetical protein
MFKGLLDILKDRGLRIENRQGSRGGFAGIFDAEVARHHGASPGLRRSILGEGRKCPAPTAATVMAYPMTEYGKPRAAPSEAEMMKKYLTDGGLHREDF